MNFFTKKMNFKLSKALCVKFINEFNFFFQITGTKTSTLLVMTSIFVKYV